MGTGHKRTEADDARSTPRRATTGPRLPDVPTTGRSNLSPSTTKLLAALAESERNYESLLAEHRALQRQVAQGQ